MAADGKPCGVRLPAGSERVVVSAPICQNAIRRTMKALISTSRPIIFKWLLAVESNQSITDKILLKAALSLCLSHSLSLYPSLSLLLFRFRRLRHDILLLSVLLSDIAAVDVAYAVRTRSHTQSGTSEFVNVFTHRQNTEFYSRVLHSTCFCKLSKNGNLQTLNIFKLYSI